MSRWKSGMCALGLWLGLGCGADELPDVEDGEAVASQTEALRGATYFAARPDLRRCAAPLCGGSFVRALNGEVTACVDGTKARECYVERLDLSPLGLSTARAERLIQEQRKVVFAGIIRQTGRFGLGALAVQEAWRGVNDVAAATTLRTTNAGIVCITTPCPTHVGELVNRDHRFSLSPDFSKLKASNADLGRIHKAMDEQGALLSGRLVGASGRLATIAVTQAYLQVASVLRCGSRGLPACAAGTYCQFDEGACGELDHPGVCTARPTACTDIYQPVCGCDGVTYGNACEAAAAGASVDHEGACGSSEEVLCGGIQGLSCPGAGACRIDTGCPDGRADCPVCADCTGVCQCSGAAVLCGPGTVFDDSPRVCSCVPTSAAK